MKQQSPLGVVGRPIYHSLSPEIFRRLCAAEGEERPYLRIAAGSAGEALGLFETLGLQGMNVTAPFKEGVAERLGGLRDGAAALRAVNCVVRRPEGGIVGTNTDPSGVIEPLRRRGVEVKDRPCLVIGAGGAGRAACYALGKAGGVVTVVNRTVEKAARAAALAGPRSSTLSLEDLRVAASRAEIIVSSLRSEHLPEPASWLPPGAVVVDADYRRGALAGFAKERGCTVVSGVEWLVHQALPAFSAFIGREARVDSAGLCAELEGLLSGREARAARGIALIGLPASGKTSVGSRLAVRRGIPFVDSDGEVEAEAGRSVREIFSEEGEQSFRAREKRALARIAERGPLILATGGGIPLDPDNRALLARHFVTVWLHVLPATAAERTRGAGPRPLFSGGAARERIESFSVARSPLYASIADLVVPTEGRDPDEVVAIVEGELAGLF